MYVAFHSISTSVFTLFILFQKDRIDMNIHGVPLEESMDGVVFQSGSKPVIFSESGDIALPTVRESEPAVGLVDLAHQTVREIVLPP